MRYVQEDGLRQREAADTTHVNVRGNDEIDEIDDVNETSSFLSSGRNSDDPHHHLPSGTSNNGDTTAINQFNSVEVLRRRVKSLDKLNVHEEAVETCDRCPDVCFTTMCGIHFHPLNNIILLIWSSGVLFFLIVVSTALSNKWEIVGSESTTAVALHHTHHLDYPAITICNMASEVPLTPIKCSSFDSSKTCPEYKVPIAMKKNLDSQGERLYIIFSSLQVERERG
jgi:hypothetical protein